MSIPRLPDAELFIMKIIWSCGDEITSAQLMKELAGKKDWVQTTVLNFLARLVERGFLSVERRGKVNVYKPIINEHKYLETESKLFMKHLHDNSIKSFMASLYSGKSISQQDLDELKTFIEQKAGEKY